FRLCRLEGGFGCRLVAGGQSLFDLTDIGAYARAPVLVDGRLADHLARRLLGRGCIGHDASLRIFSISAMHSNGRSQKTNGQPQGRLGWCGLIVQLFRRVNESFRDSSQRFWKRGGRFSTKAAMPSFWSSSANMEWKSRRSKRRPSDSVVSQARLTPPS